MQKNDYTKVKDSYSKGVVMIPARSQLSQIEIISMLSHVPLFTGIGLIEQKMIADKCIIVNHKADDIVIEQDEFGDTLYIIIRGTVQVLVKTTSMEWKRIANLSAGDVFGEIAVLRKIPRTARVSTLTPCQFLTINAKDFLEAYQYFPPRARDNIQLVVAKRLQERGLFIRM